MYSKTKHTQSEDALRRMAASALGLNRQEAERAAVRELTGGYFNAAYELTFAAGRQVIVKIAPCTDRLLTYEKNIMQAEVEAMRLTEEKTAVPVPHIYCYDSTHQLCESDYFFMEKLEGLPYSECMEGMTDEEREQIEESLGRCNAVINGLKGLRFGCLGRPKEQKNSWREAFAALLEEALNDGMRASADLGVGYDEVRFLVSRNLDVLDEVTEPALVHWDLWDGNVFVKDGKITGIIDFERALWGDPLMEHYFRMITESKRPEAFLRGYGRTAFSENEMTRRLLYNIYMYVIMIVECYYREYEDDGQYRWSVIKLKESLDMLERRNGRK